MTFHDEDEASPSTSALGPFDEITIHTARVVGERAQVGTVIAAHGANGRWRAADPGLQAGLEAGRGDASRSHIRVYTETPELLVRVFDDEPEPSAAVAEIGPFSVIDLGTYELRADALILAVRVSSMAPWLLTDNAGTELEGVAKKVLALRANSARRAPTVNPPAFVESIGSRVTPPAPIAVPMPSVWVDRVRHAPEIYISRPDPAKKR